MQRHYFKYPIPRPLPPHLCNPTEYRSKSPSRRSWRRRDTMRWKTDEELSVAFHKGSLSLEQRYSFHSCFHSLSRRLFITRATISYYLSCDFLSRVLFLSLERRYSITRALFVSLEPISHKLDALMAKTNLKCRIQWFNDRSKSKLSRRNWKRKSIRDIQNTMITKLRRLLFRQDVVELKNLESSFSLMFHFSSPHLHWWRWDPNFLFLTMTGMTEASPIDEVETQKNPVVIEATPVA